VCRLPQCRDPLSGTPGSGCAPAAVDLAVSTESAYELVNEELTPPVRATLALVREPESVGKARTFVRAMLQIWECQDPEEIATLLTSEAVTNAIRYSHDGITVELSLVSDEVLLIETSDDNPSPPIVGSSTPTSESGRGMLLVDALARRWGVRPAGDRKVVWFEVSVRRSTLP
jgi:anti-sigma regulatory factor (Ser/Thr protein kinase)